MANQLPDAETARDLEALPADLQPLYRRLTLLGDRDRPDGRDRVHDRRQGL